MGYSFNCCGHKNISARHKNTFEFTKDEEVNPEGDCIVGVMADFSLAQLKSFIKSLGGNKRITITIEASNYGGEGCNYGSYNNNKNSNKKAIKQKNNKKLIEKINCEVNPGFNSDREIVIRKTEFISERTLGIKADKAASDMGRDLAALLRKNAQVEIRLSKK